MVSNQFAFIVAVTNEQYFEECVYYINRLAVPDGFDIDVLAVQEAESMCGAYNLAMQNSGAKYKIYLHQDVFIRNERFLYELLRIFEGDASIGMIGMLGGNGMPRTGMAFCSWNEGVVDARNPDMAYLMYGSDTTREDVTVEAVDGLLIATQYDIPWRDDLFTDFDFYDVSQSFEMQKAGYKVVVPYQLEPWTIHDSSLVKLKNYNKNRKICLQEYPDFFYADNGIEYAYHAEWDELSLKLGEQLKQLIGMAAWDEVKCIIDGYRKNQLKDTTLEICGIMSDIHEAERTEDSSRKFFEGMSSYAEMYAKYVKTRFLLRRMELGLPECEYVELVQQMAQKKISCQALNILILHSVLDKKITFLRLKTYYEKLHFTSETEYVRRVYELVKDRPVPAAYVHSRLAKSADV